MIALDPDSLLCVWSPNKTDVCLKQIERHVRTSQSTGSSNQTQSKEEQMFSGEQRCGLSNSRLGNRLRGLRWFGWLVGGNTGG